MRKHVLLDKTTQHTTVRKSVAKMSERRYTAEEGKKESEQTGKFRDWDEKRATEDKNTEVTKMETERE